jgi:hypothetical protein
MAVVSTPSIRSDQRTMVIMGKRLRENLKHLAVKLISWRRPGEPIGF